MDEERSLHAEAHDSHGAIWNLRIRHKDSTSLWRGNDKVAELSWDAISSMLAGAGTPSVAAVDILAMLSRLADGRLPLTVGNDLVGQVAGWLERDWRAQ